MSTFLSIDVKALGFLKRSPDKKKNNNNDDNNDNNNNNNNE